jgi:hypothetical protein
MEWLDDDDPEHEEILVGYVMREHSAIDAGQYRELASPGDDAERSAARIAAGCACGWRSPRWIPTTPAKWARSSLDVGNVDYSRAHRLWKRHVMLDVRSERRVDPAALGGSGGQTEQTGPTLGEWTPAAVNAIDRAFFEVVESEWWEFGVDPEEEDSAIAALAAIPDIEAPAHNRMDLLIAQHARRIDAPVLRAIARLFASSQLGRIQPPNARDPNARNKDEGPSDILEFINVQAAAGTLFRPDFDPSEDQPEPEPTTRVPKTHRLTEHTLLSMHIRTLRAYAETLEERGVVSACDDALGSPIDPLAWTLNLRRRLAGLYNAFLMDGMTPLGHWTARALRHVALAAGRIFYYPDLLPRSDPDDPDELPVFDPIAEAQALLRDVQPDEVPYDDQADLQRIQTARSYDASSMRAMARLYSHALDYRLQRAEGEIGRAALDRS